MGLDSNKFSNLELRKSFNLSEPARDGHGDALFRPLNIIHVQEPGVLAAWKLVARFSVSLSRALQLQRDAIPTWEQPSLRGRLVEGRVAYAVLAIAANLG